MRFRIHRGSHEIGGNCVEVEAEGRRILLDIGRPLDPEVDPVAAVPDVVGLRGEPDPSLLGVILSHGHLDHHGLLPLIASHVSVYAGREAAAIANAAAPFLREPVRIDPAAFLEDGVPLVLGPFGITPYRADHSAFGAFSLVIEAGGRTLVYSGDFRSHGRTRAFRDFLRRIPRRPDVLLLEGTSLGQNVPLDGRAKSERELERDLTDEIRAARGLVLVAFSPQNVDRWVTVYRATLRAGRTFVGDLYGEEIALATGRRTIPHGGFERYEVLVPSRQRARMIDAGMVPRVERVRPWRVFPEKLADRRRELVLAFRAGTIADLERHDCLEDALLIWSQWRGYLEDGRSPAVLDFLKRHGMPHVVQHTSGHAAPADLRRLAETIRPKTLVPMHGVAPERFREFFPDVTVAAAGAWMEL
ncbi:MAG: MBL fold metallo-hydrolase [Acidobacteria bacterium]|nr:MBL fold metallo-hydrolase [Acidobacteriota bacterium]